MSHDREKELSILTLEPGAAHMSRHYVVSLGRVLNRVTDSVMRLDVQEQRGDHRHSFLTTQVSLLISHVCSFTS
jgi:hypothetical protein